MSRPRLRICDLTFAFTPTSGGIRTYLLQKRRHLVEDETIEHVLVVPGAEDTVVHEGRCTTYTVASPYIPGCRPYRWFVRPDAVYRVLQAAAPDIIEVGTFFVEPGAAFRYRDSARQRGRRCIVGGYFHTDLAESYVAAPLRSLFRATAFPRPNFGFRLAARIANQTLRWFGRTYRHCDLMCAGSPMQVERLRQYGIRQPHLVPLGVDAEQFDPRWRSAACRAELGVAEGATLLMFAGRLDWEKQVPILLQAFRQLQLPGAVLCVAGEGPARAELEQAARELPHLRVLPYQSNPATLARLLASADIYVTAAPHETFGLSVIEAQAAGLPVVGIAHGAMLERVPPGVGRLGPAGDAAAMARNIEAVAREARALGEAARAHVLASGLSWRSTFQRWRDVYFPALARTPAASAGAWLQH